MKFDFSNMPVGTGLGDVLLGRCIEYFGSIEEFERETNDDPYCIIRVEGIGFYRADKFAKTMYSVRDDDPRRQRAIIIKSLQDNTALGHSYLPLSNLQKVLAKEGVLNLPTEHLLELENKGLLTLEKDGNEINIYLRNLYKAEIDSAEFLISRLNKADLSQVKNWDYSARVDFKPDIDQLTVLNNFLCHPLVIVTGMPGSGKTAIVNEICNIIDFLYPKSTIALCAPTGKAAKRLADLTKRDASTIHRLLDAGWGHWGRYKGNPISYDYVISDESSMLDISLFWRLTQALKPDTKLILVGDVDQLAPVGPGSPFRDIIRSGKFPVFKLRFNHRQGEGSGIATVAREINYGNNKLSFNDQDMHFILCENQINIREMLPKVLSYFEKVGYPSMMDCHVLTPQHKTTVGVSSLNDYIRPLLNPKPKAVGYEFGVGDKVMQMNNNYTLEIFNGYLGQIVEEEKKHWKIMFDNEIMTYDKKFSGELNLAYASSVHKFQGSEIPCAVVICSSAHPWMLTRNLLYTAITRAKKRCVILGDLPALKKCIWNIKEAQRFSSLIRRF